MIKSIISKLYKFVQLLFFKRNWRRLNDHNYTIVKSIFPTSIVTVGNKSYGTITLKHFGNNNEKLNIGNYVSIAENVVFVLGGIHNISSVTCYPLYSRLITLKPELDARTKGAIVIEDEAWIGYGALILSGVTIGKGAIVGAGSIVTKDVLPYSIVAGNPAKLVRYRFTPEIIEKLKEFDLNSFTTEEIVSQIESFYENVNSFSGADQIINSIKSK